MSNDIPEIPVPIYTYRPNELEGPMSEFEEGTTFTVVKALTGEVVGTVTLGPRVPTEDDDAFMVKGFMIKGEESA